MDTRIDKVDDFACQHGLLLPCVDAINAITHERGSILQKNRRIYCCIVHHQVKFTQCIQQRIKTIINRAVEAQNWQNYLKESENVMTNVELTVVSALH